MISEENKAEAEAMGLFDRGRLTPFSFILVESVKQATKASDPRNGLTEDNKLLLIGEFTRAVLGQSAWTPKHPDDLLVKLGDKVVYPPERIEGQ